MIVGRQPCSSRELGVITRYCTILCIVSIVVALSSSGWDSGTARGGWIGRYTRHSRESRDNYTRALAVPGILTCDALRSLWYRIETPVMEGPYRERRLSHFELCQYSTSDPACEIQHAYINGHFPVTLHLIKRIEVE